MWNGSRSARQTTDNDDGSRSCLNRERGEHFEGRERKGKEEDGSASLLSLEENLLSKFRGERKDVERTSEVNVSLSLSEVSSE